MFLAVDLFEENFYDLVFMDIEMPEMDGYEATQKIRDIERENARSPVPVVAMTAFSESEAESLAAGCDLYFVKPVTKEAILKIVQKCAKNV